MSFVVSYGGYVAVPSFAYRMEVSMLESYSTNVVVGENAFIPFNTNVIDKGCTTKQTSDTSFALNKCGVYEVHVNVSGNATSVAGNVAIEMYKDGVPVAQSLQQAYSATTTDIVNVGFDTLVQVNHDNCNCCCSSPVVLTVANVGTGATLTNADIVITKIC